MRLFDIWCDNDYGEDREDNDLVAVSVAIDDAISLVIARLSLKGGDSDEEEGAHYLDNAVNTHCWSCRPPSLGNVEDATPTALER